MNDKLVPYSIVKELIDLYEERNKYQDWSDIYEDLTTEIEVQKKLIYKSIQNEIKDI